MQGLLPDSNVPSAAELAQELDFGVLVGTDGDDRFLQPLADRAVATVQHFKPLTVEERIAAFKEIGYRPGGLYLPDDKALAQLIRARVTEIGDIHDDTVRLDQYFKLQAETGDMQKDGVFGQWHGQMAITLSEARFRIVIYGRRGGKTFHSAREIEAVLRKKRRSVVLIVGAVMDHVERLFDVVARLLEDLGHRKTARVWRDSENEKLIVLENGSQVRGASLDSPKPIAGLAVDLAVVEESAYVTKEHFENIVLPTLSDKLGQALIIGAHDPLAPQETYFYQVYKRAQRDAEAAAKGQREVLEANTWDYFRDASWDVNFFAFPQGRMSPAMRANEENVDARDFLVQYGAVALPSRLLVYPELRRRVHVGHYPWQPDIPITLTGDPSGGSSPYAVAVLQDHGSHVNQIDELYEVGSMANAEAISEMLLSRPWCQPDMSNIAVFLMDPAATDDIRRLANLGWPMEGVFEKPQIWLRLPIMRNQLRDPAMFLRLMEAYKRQILVEMGYPVEVDLNEIPTEDEGKVLLQLEEALSDDSMTEEDRANLQACSRYFVDETCFNTIHEFESYRYSPSRNMRNVRENPQDKDNHILDALGYFNWQYKRFDESRLRPAHEFTVRGRPVLLNVQSDLRGAEQITLEGVAPIGLEYAKTGDDHFKARMGAFIRTMRMHTEDRLNPDYSLLERQ